MAAKLTFIVAAAVFAFAMVAKGEYVSLANAAVLCVISFLIGKHDGDGQ